MGSRRVYRSRRHPHAVGRPLDEAVALTYAVRYGPPHRRRRATRVFPATDPRAVGDPSMPAPSPPDRHLPSARILRRADVLARVSRFPNDSVAFAAGPASSRPSFRISAGLVGWHEQDVTDWIEERRRTKELGTPGPDVRNRVPKPPSREGTSMRSRAEQIAGLKRKIAEIKNKEPSTASTPVKLLLTLIYIHPFFGGQFSMSPGGQFRVSLDTTAGLPTGSRGSDVSRRLASPAMAPRRTPTISKKSL